MMPSKEAGEAFSHEQNSSPAIYVTNALDPPQDLAYPFVQTAPALAHEATQVNDVKRHQRLRL